MIKLFYNTASNIGKISIAFRESSGKTKNVIVLFLYMSSLLIECCFCIFFARPKYAVRV
jgi:hypothetical protein